MYRKHYQQKTPTDNQLVLKSSLLFMMIPPIFKYSFILICCSLKLLGQQPNILLIYTDDQSMMSDRDLPHVMPFVYNEIKQKGINFTNYICSTPFCAPSRASLLTGQYSHNHGHKNNSYHHQDWKPKYENDNLACWVKNAGYYNIFIGKFFNPMSMELEVSCWDEFMGFYGASYTETSISSTLSCMKGKIKEGSHRTISEAEAAEKTIDKYLKNKVQSPLFLYYAPVAPHSPRPSDPKEVMYEAKYSNIIQDTTINKDVAFNENDYSDKLIFNNKINEEQVDNWNKHRFRSLRNLDDAIKKIIQKLKAVGLYENTYVLFTSDNGYHLGQNRRLYKRHPYELSINVPFYVRLPYNAQPINHSNELITTIDLAATITNIAGGKTTVPQDGIDVSGTFKGETLNRKYVMSEMFFEKKDKKVDWKVLRRKNSVLISFEGVGHEYYDLTADSFQVNNVFKSTPAQILDIQLLEQLKDCKGKNCH